MQVTAIIPVKSFGNAKQRLSPMLGRAERELLAEAMFRDVARRVIGARGLAATVVVTGDRKVGEIAMSLGAQVILEQVESGETDAVELACAELKRRGTEAVLVVPGDIPLVRAEDIEEIVRQLPARPSPAPFALLTPSHDRMGTNALLLRPPDVIKLRFGYDSFNYHLSQVSARGLPRRFLENERIALDIDEPGDLKKFLASGDDSESRRAALEMTAAAREAAHGRGSGSL